MTKDWDSVETEIKDLSWVQKKRLDEVKKIMETRRGFKASTRAYRMKLAEWGLTKKAAGKVTKDHRSRKKDKRRRREEEQGNNGDDDDAEGDGSDSTVRGASNDRAPQRVLTPRDPENLETMLLSRAAVHTDPMDADPVDPNLALFDQNGNLVRSSTFEPTSERQTLDPFSQAGTVVTDILMSMLNAVLDADSQKLESLIMKNPNYINYPVGMPFEAHGGRFFNHPAISQCVMLQHPDQTLFDIACALPSGPTIWILLAHGAKGSKHPFGTDLAFHNAIKNGRTITVQALLVPGRSKIVGEQGVTWKPLLQAVFWNQPDIVRLLVDKGANVNDRSTWIDGITKSALQFCLDRREKDYRNLPVRERCEKILKTLLNAGADVLLQPDDGDIPTPFQTFLKPWRGDPHWIRKVSPVEMECLEAFVRKGADLKTAFAGFACTAPSSGTFEHQVLWHSTPVAARLLIDHAAPNPDGNGSSLLHEIVGSCPDAKRHPSDTLRDVEVLLKRGADPNLVDGSGFTPLRHCIERCPAVDIVPRLRMLLEGGADPELKHSNRLPPFVLAARTFDEPLRSQVMDFLVAKMKGRQPRVVYDDTFYWSEGYFPIPDAPTFAQVQWYNGQNSDFNANVERMVPVDVRAAFQRACFSVVSMNFLNAATARAKMHQPLPMLSTDKDEMFEVLVQRQIAKLPEYRFEQEFVMSLLKPHMAPVLANLNSHLNSGTTSGTEQDDILLPHQTPILSSAPSAFSTLATSSGPSTATTTVFPPSPDFAPNPDTSSSRRLSISSTSSTDSIIPTTTLVRWSAIGDPTRQSHIKKSKDAVLKYTCKECGGGNLLTKAEVERHQVEHEHSRGCVKQGCRRRFCVGRT